MRLPENEASLGMGPALEQSKRCVLVENNKLVSLLVTRCKECDDFATLHNIMQHYTTKACQLDCPKEDLVTAANSN